MRRSPSESRGLPGAGCGTQILEEPAGQGLSYALTAMPTGPVSDEALGDYFTSAAAFVSLSRHEGFGVPPLEAMSFGTPVVALGEAATPEIVADGGIVVDRFDPATLAELLYDVAHDDALRAKLIEAGYRRLAHLSAEKATARFKEVVEAITA